MEELCCNTKKKPKNAPYEIKVNEKELIKSLSPLVQDAKNYLYAQDMTEEEIQSMIKENNATEIDLIPLVMKLTEMDMKYDQLAHNDMSWLSLFGTTAYAQDLTARDIVNCALPTPSPFTRGILNAKRY